jgi:hypothetical protein
MLSPRYGAVNGSAFPSSKTCSSSRSSARASTSASIFAVATARFSASTTSCPVTARRKSFPRLLDSHVQPCSSALPSLSLAESLSVERAWRRCRGQAPEGDRTPVLRLAAGVGVSLRVSPERELLETHKLLNAGSTGRLQFAVTRHSTRRGTGGMNVSLRVPFTVSQTVSLSRFGHTGSDGCVPASRTS